MTTATSEPRPRVLLVDDDPRILAGLRRQLYRRYEVVTAGGGEEGLAAIRSGDTFALVISDMRMPGMDGATFLAAVRRTAPWTTRILLTGQTELATAIRAINDGQVFRFLDKPCPQELLDRTLDEAVTRYRVVGEKHEMVAATLADRRVTSSAEPGRPRAGTASEQFQLRYQLVVSLPTGTATAVQAILHGGETRSTDSDRPGAAEPTVPLLRWGMAAACQEVASWPALASANALNVTIRMPADQLHDPRMSDDMAQTLVLSGLPPERIVMELDDTVDLSEPAVDQRLAAVVSRGVQLRLVHSDDAALTRCIAGDVPFTSVKLTSPALLDSGNATVALVRESGLDLAVEGIRSYDDHRAAVAAGCSSAQGPYYSGDDEPGHLLTRLVGLRTVAQRE